MILYSTSISHPALNSSTVSILFNYKKTHKIYAHEEGREEKRRLGRGGKREARKGEVWKELCAVGIFNYFRPRPHKYAINQSINQSI